MEHPMSITPQAIKDQEFQVKFRGYDAIEVKAYLELLAEEFFELHEQNRKLSDDSALLAEEKEILQAENETLLQESRKHKDELEGLRTEGKQKNSEHLALQKEAEELRGQLAGSRRETELAKEVIEAAEERMRSEKDKAAVRLQEELEAAEARINQEKDMVRQGQLEIEKLRHQLQLLEKEIQELKKGDADFKSTIVAAQKFSEDLKMRSEKEARELMEQAREDVETFRRKAHEELARLPLEIERLQNKRLEVRNELKMILNGYLHELDTFPEIEGAGKDEDLNELFQSIHIPENGEIEVEDLEKINLKLA
jgi:DivIVA domain-containing protein